MNNNRKAAEAYIINYIDKILPDGKNKALYQQMFKKMSDEDFDNYMLKLDKGEITLSMIAPNGKKPAIDIENNLKIAKEIGHEFFQKVWQRTPDKKGWYLSYDKYMVMHLPVARQAQHLTKKISMPEHNRSIDNLTGQPVGDSKGSKISLPELMMLLAQGLTQTSTEYFKYRGGDEKAFQVMNTSIARTGGASIQALDPYTSVPKSTRTLSIYLSCMHLSNNLPTH